MDERLMRHDVVVFDVGGVLVRFEPKEIAEGFGLSDELYKGVFQSGLWMWLDTGLISVGELADMMCQAAHTDNREDYLRVADLMENFHKIERPLSGSLLLPELKRAGKKLYYLSNYGTPMFEKTMQRFRFFELFDGGVVSGREHIMKPMPRIYELLCERYGFKPQDAIFLDDNEDNIRAAERLGFDVWRYIGTLID